MTFSLMHGPPPPHPIKPCSFVWSFISCAPNCVALLISLTVVLLNLLISFWSTFIWYRGPKWHRKIWVGLRDRVFKVWSILRFLFLLEAVSVYFNYRLVWQTIRSKTSHHQLWPFWDYLQFFRSLYETPTVDQLWSGTLTHVMLYTNFSLDEEILLK